MLQNKDQQDNIFTTKILYQINPPYQMVFYNQRTLGPELLTYQ